MTLTCRAPTTASTTRTRRAVSGFLGSAKVNPSVTMGFEFLMDIGTGVGGTTFAVNQLDEDGKRSDRQPVGQ